MNEGEHVATPNTESEPMWSFGGEPKTDMRETKTERVPEPVREIEPVVAAPDPAPAPEPRKIAEAAPLEPAAPAQPARKGWWQRTFSQK